MRSALRQGDVVLQAFPFNAQPELLSADLFDFAISVAQNISRDIGIPSPLVLSQRDVPGLSRGVVHRLASHGVIGINVGINDASAPVGVPTVESCLRDGMATPFVWRDNATGSEVIAAFHPGGCKSGLLKTHWHAITFSHRATIADGKIGRDLFGSMRCDCLTAPGLDEALCYGWQGDNGVSYVLIY